MQFEQLNLFDNYRDHTLPLFSYPKNDELFTSWVIRLANDHHVKAFTFTKDVFKERDFWKIDKDRSASDSNLKAIHSRTGIDLQTISNTTLKSYEGKISTSISHERLRTWIMHQVRLSGQISANYVLFCPGCLKKDQTPYFRKKWRLGLSFCCLDCKLNLQECCPQCHKPILFHNHTIGINKSVGYSMKYCYNCHLDLSNVHAQATKEEELVNQSFLYNLLDNGYNSQFSYSHLYFDGLLHLSQLLISKQNTDFNTALSKALGESLEVSKRTGDFCSLNLADRAKIINSIVWALENWPDRFIDICKDNNLSYFHFFRKKIITPYWLYMPIKMELYQGKLPLTNKFPKRKF